jgi:large subunit ribosomal protein L17
MYGNPLGRKTGAAKALYRVLSSEVLERGQIKTTLAKAKAVQSLIDHLVFLGKKRTPAARRQAEKILGSPQLVPKLFGEIAAGYLSRPSGFTRISRFGPRAADGAEMARIELVEKDTTRTENQMVDNNKTKNTGDEIIDSGSEIRDKKMENRKKTRKKRV